MTDNAHGQRMADYLDTQDAAADWTPEGGDDRGCNPPDCPSCGHALEVDADGWYVCDDCGWLGNPRRPAGRQTRMRR